MAILNLTWPVIKLYRIAQAEDQQAESSFVETVFIDAGLRIVDNDRLYLPEDLPLADLVTCQ